MKGGEFLEELNAHKLLLRKNLFNEMYSYLTLITNVIRWGIERKW
jgi:hypothetical protein